MADARFIPGQRVLNEAEPALGLGLVEDVLDHRNVQIRFPAADVRRVYNVLTAPLRRVVLSPGQVAVGRDGTRFKVDTVRRREGLLVYRGAPRSSGPRPVLLETDLADVLPTDGAADRLLHAQLAPHGDFELRADGWRLRRMSLARATRGVVGARVRLLPHQLYIAHEVSRREVPRVLLADEVGLGKTIEAGLIFCALRSLDRADRVLILVPDSLVHQWLAEYYRRFNEMFTVLDESRCEELDESGLSAFQQSRRVITSLTFLANHAKRLRQAAEVDWDLVMVDEAHHLEWDVTGSSRAYQAVERLSRSANGLLLLTATPMREGLATEFGLLRLVDHDRFHDFEAFKAEQTHLREVAKLARKLSEQGPEPQVLGALRTLFPDDHALHEHLDRVAVDPEARRHVLQELVDRHGTGRVLIRNRRDRLQGFPERILHATRLEQPRQWGYVYSILEAAAFDEDDLAALGSSILQVGPRLMRAKDPDDRGPLLEPRTLRTAWEADPRVAWTLQFLREHAGEKVLLICSRQATVTALQAAIRGKSAIQTGVFHEGLTVVERDRQAAWFAEPDGAQVLLCSEIGGEGRNFQFAHHLVLFDLPTDPDVLEQRIGRLDRIGQDRAIHIHVPYVAQTPQEALFEWHHGGLHSFEKPVHGSEQVMRALRTPLLEVLRAWLPTSPLHPERAARLQALLEKSARALAEVRKRVVDSVDYLVDLNSFDAPAGEALAEAIRAVDEDPALEEYMERLLDRFGVQDEVLDKQGRRRIHPGDLMFVESFPGLPEDGIGATYRRDLALAREDLDFLSLDHPLVEGALSLLLDQSAGIASLCAWPEAPEPGLLFQFLFVLEASGPAALELPRYLPTTPLVLTLDHTGARREDLGEVLRERLGDLRKAETRLITSQQELLRGVLPRLEEAAHRGALEALAAEKARAVEEADALLAEEHERLQELARLNPTLPPREIEGHAAKRESTLNALRAAEARLDALRLVVMEAPQK